MVDSELINQILDKNQDAFKELVRRYRKMVSRTCYNFVRSNSDAEYLAQEVFIEIFVSVKKFRKQSSFSTWIYRICINKSLNFIQKKKRESKMIEAYSETIKLDVEIDTEEHSRVLLLRKGLSQLPDKQKTALVLHKCNGIPHKEISEIMGLSVSAIESLIFRAKTNLKKIIIDNELNNINI